MDGPATLPAQGPARACRPARPARAQGRVIFRAFGQYIQLPPPWSYLVVTAALYGAAALAVLHAAGLLGAQLWSTLAGDARRDGAARLRLPAGRAAPAPVL